MTQPPIIVPGDQYDLYHEETLQVSVLAALDITPAPIFTPPQLQRWQVVSIVLEWTPPDGAAHDPSRVYGDDVLLEVVSGDKTLVSVPAAGFMDVHSRQVRIVLNSHISDLRINQQAFIQATGTLTPIPPGSTLDVRVWSTLAMQVLMPSEAPAGAPAGTNPFMHGYSGPALKITPDPPIDVIGEAYIFPFSSTPFPNGYVLASTASQMGIGARHERELKTDAIASLKAQGSTAIQQVVTLGG